MAIPHSIASWRSNHGQESRNGDTRSSITTPECAPTGDGGNGAGTAGGSGRQAGRADRYRGHRGGMVDRRRMVAGSVATAVLPGAPGARPGADDFSGRRIGPLVRAVVLSGAAPGGRPW